MNCKEVIVEDKKFNSISDAARYYGIDPRKISSRLNKGWTLEEALEIVERNIDRHTSNDKEITVEGNKFNTISEAARHYNLSYRLVESRLSSGWSIEEAFGIVERNNNNNTPITVEGVEYESISDACKHYNLDYRLVLSRLNKFGWSVEEAFGFVERNINGIGKGKEITVGGKTFESIAEACRYYDLEKEYTRIIYRLNNGWSVEAAFNEYIELIYFKGTEVTVEDNNFVSIKEAAHFYNMDYGLVRARLHKGWTIEEAFELVERKTDPLKGKEITVKGRKFNSIISACRYYNIDQYKVRKKINKGDMSIDDIFDMMISNKNPLYNGKEITIEGKTFPTIAEACRHYNLTVEIGTIHRRLRDGWTIEEAFELVERKIDPLKGKEVILESKTFVSFAEACRHYNLNSETIRSRLRDGWTIEEAFELVERKEKPRKGNEVILKGKTFNSISEACRYYNLNFETVHCRLRKGWSVEEAFELVKRKEKPRKGNEVILEGKTFVSLTEAAKYYNFKFELIRGRLRKGWTLEEAFELVPRQKKKK